MKLVFKNMGHILSFDEGVAVELVIENRKFFCDLVNSLSLQTDGAAGDAVLSLADKPVEFARHADMTVQFAPFLLNRKTLLTKLQAYLEKKALMAENYSETMEILNRTEGYVQHLAEELPFAIDCKKVAIGYLIKALSPECEESGESTIEKVFTYMEMVRELDCERLFIMVNMRTYFSDEEMARFVESVNLHGFQLLLLESTAFPGLKDVKRYTVDEDLCEF